VTALAFDVLNGPEGELYVVRCVDLVDQYLTSI
jgi:hypothetical protein